jgi:CDP-paratose 2-epimerase
MMSGCVLVTGGAGFIGSNLALRFMKSDPRRRVIAFDNLRRRGSEMNLAVLKKAGVEFVHGDVRNPADLSAIEARVELLIECSAEPSVLAGYGADPSYLIDSNLVGAINCMDLARRTGAGMIFLSTSRVYPIAALNSLSVEETETRFELSEGQSLPGASRDGIAEEFTVEGIRSLYGATKLCAEMLIQEYRAAYGLSAVINRCGVVSGPGQFGKVDQGVFALWMGMHHFGRPLRYIGWGGTGKQVRDVLHVEDLADLVEWEAANLGEVDGAVFNVGGGRERSLSLLETTLLCRSISGKTVPVEPVPETRPGDLRVYITDTSRIEAVAPWRPRRSAATIMEDIYMWLRDNESVVSHLWLAE